MRSLKKLVKQSVSEWSRLRKLDLFYSVCKGGRLLDVGVSAKGGLAGMNLFLKTFRFPPSTYVGLGVEDLTSIAATNHPKSFVRYSGSTFPFRDKVFEWVFSNAVLEHVGCYDRQLYFIKEMLRVGKNVFLTTPNKYFPLETHSNLVVLHFCDRVFYHYCSRRKPWIGRENLNLLCFRKLRRLMQESGSTRYEIIRNRFCGVTMTFTIIAG